MFRQLIQLPFAFALLLLCAHVGAQNIRQNNPALQVAVGWTKPPYVIANDNSGFELELIRSLFAGLGKRVNFVYIPYGRSYTMLKRGEVDAVMTLKAGIDIGDKAVLSESYVSYQNVLVALKQNSVNLLRVSDISQFSLVGFQNAQKHLGQQYAQAVKKSPLYVELADQHKQVEMLLQKRVDLVAMDLNIFKYWLARSHPELSMKDIKVFRLFGKTQYHLGLRNADLKAEFDQALTKFKASEQYRQLLERYDLEM